MKREMLLDPKIFSSFRVFGLVSSFFGLIFLQVASEGVDYPTHLGNQLSGRCSRCFCRKSSTISEEGEVELCCRLDQRVLIHFVKIRHCTFPVFVLPDAHVTLLAAMLGASRLHVFRCDRVRAVSSFLN
jgi:hypothetical protein